MYTQTPAPCALAHGFSTLATWVHEGPSWSGLLAADPGFEISWSARDGVIDVMPCLTPATRQCATVVTTAGPRRIRTLRLRPQAVGTWLGPVAQDLVDGGSVDLRDLGPRWRTLREATTEAELFQTLAQLPLEKEDSMVHASVARLRAAQPPPYPHLAAEMGYSYEQWRRRMRAATGVSPKFLARYLRLQRATRLARARPGMGMAEIAFRTGFSTDCLLAAESASLSGRTFRALVAGFTLPE